MRYLFLVLVLICLIGCNLHASFEPNYPPYSLDESQQDQARVHLAETNPLYDNVGMIHAYALGDESPGKNNPLLYGSTVYIGGIFCLTAAHVVRHKNVKYFVQFDVQKQRSRFYPVKQVISHSRYDQNKDFDIAIVLLHEPVVGLNGLNPCYGFSKTHRYFQDNQHLLVYIGYGARLICDDWLCVFDQKRRAMQAYTHSCKTDAPDQHHFSFGIHSTPYGNSNSFQKKRALIPFEAKGLISLSGGAVIHPNYGLVSIHSGVTTFYRGSVFLESKQKIYIYSMMFLNLFIDFFSFFLFQIPSFNYCRPIDKMTMHSVPLGPFQGWIEETKRDYLA